MTSTLITIIKGFCMGAADIVPGVSGGTMALILGIYQTLIKAIKSLIDPQFLRAALNFRFAEAWRVINGNFLLSLGLGIGLAIITLARPLEHLLETQPTLVWSFFFGLVLASVWLVGKRLDQIKGATWLAILAGAISAYLIVGLVPINTPNDPWFLILSGAVAICAMILPGISGAFLLVILGKYAFVLHAVNTGDFSTIGYVGLGAIIGIILFSQVLHWLLRMHYHYTLAVLVGLMLGSLRKIWPWQTVDGDVILPVVNADFWTVVSLMVVGALTVLLLNRLSESD